MALKIFGKGFTVVTIEDIAENFCESWLALLGFLGSINDIKVIKASLLIDNSANRMYLRS